MLIEFLDSLIFSIYLYSKAVRLFIGNTIELSSKYFTQIHRLLIPLRKSNNAVKLIVSLKQNSLEGFTTNGFSKIPSSHLRPLNFAQNALCATLDKNANFNISKNMLYKVWTTDCL